MKYVIYAAVALLILWAVVYLVRHVRRQLRGGRGGGEPWGGDCPPGARSGEKGKKEKEAPAHIGQGPPFVSHSSAWRLRTSSMASLPERCSTVTSTTTTAGSSFSRIASRWASLSSGA